jgi:hypothetical protein
MPYHLLTQQDNAAEVKGVSLYGAISWCNIKAVGFGSSDVEGITCACFIKSTQIDGFGEILGASFDSGGEGGGDDQGITVRTADGGGGGGEQRRIFVGVDGLAAPMAGEVGFVPDDIVLDLVAVAPGELLRPVGEVGRVHYGKAIGWIAIKQRHKGEIVCGHCLNQAVTGGPIERVSEIEGLFEVLHTQCLDLGEVLYQCRIIVLFQSYIETQLRPATHDGFG